MYIGVVTDGGIIRTVFVGDTIEFVENKIIDFYNGEFDRETDDARIFDVEGNEIESMFSSD